MHNQSPYKNRAGTGTNTSFISSVKSIMSHTSSEVIYWGSISYGHWYVEKLRFNKARYIFRFAKDLDVCILKLNSQYSSVGIVTVFRTTYSQCKTQFYSTKKTYCIHLVTSHGNLFYSFFQLINLLLWKKNSYTKFWVN